MTLKWCTMYDVLVILTTFIRETIELEFGGHVDSRPDFAYYHLHAIELEYQNYAYPRKATL